MGVFIVTFGVKNMVVVQLKMFSLKRSTAGPLAVRFRLLSWLKMTGDNALHVCENWYLLGEKKSHAHKTAVKHTHLFSMGVLPPTPHGHIPCLPLIAFQPLSYTVTDMPAMYVAEEKKFLTSQLWFFLLNCFNMDVTRKEYESWHIWCTCITLLAVVLLSACSLQCANSGSATSCNKTQLASRHLLSGIHILHKLNDT